MCRKNTQHDTLKVENQFHRTSISMELISNLKGQFKQQLLLRVRICRSVSLKPCGKNSSTLTSKNAPTGMHQIDPKCLPERLPTSPKSSPKSFPNLPKPLQILSWDLFFSMELILNFKCVATWSKMTSKNDPRASKASQISPKGFPKPSPNPLKIHSKMRSRKTSFGDSFFFLQFSYFSLKIHGFVLCF